MAYRQTININDNDAPEWTTSSGSLNRNISCDNLTELDVAQALFPVAMDNCDDDVTDIVKTSGEYVPSGTCPQEGSYTNTWVVTDYCGNTSSTFTQVINIQ